MYITKQGDTWDQIAYEVYGDEKYISTLMQYNPTLLDIFVFSAGISIITPELETVEDIEDLPPWRQSDE